MESLLHTITLWENATHIRMCEIINTFMLLIFFLQIYLHYIPTLIKRSSVMLI